MNICVNGSKISAKNVFFYFIFALFIYLNLLYVYLFWPDCGSVVNNTLKSPGYPSNYPRNTICVYQIPIPCDKELVIYFNYFYLQQHWYCL